MVVDPVVREGNPRSMVVDPVVREGNPRGMVVVPGFHPVA
jgi:hypothetical protein